MDMEETPDLSAIEKDCFFHYDQLNNDGNNPFHSTALEDDFSPVLTHQKATPAAFKTPSVPPLLEKVPSKPKARPLREISEETEEPSASTSQGPSTTGGDSSEVSGSGGPSDEGDGHSSPLRGRNRRARRSEGEVGGSGTKSGGQRMSRGSSVAETQKKNRKSSGRVPLQKIPEENELQQGTSASAEDPDTDSDLLSDENSEYVPPRKKKSRLVQRSQEEEEGESSMPPKKNARGQKKSRSSRKSSSGSSDAGAGEKWRRRKVRNPIDLEVVLEAFQDFVEQYKETVDSDAVQKAIDLMAESFVDQLTEAITAIKELTTVKKKNMKLNTAINSKRAKLVDAKNELIQSEAKLRALDKEHQQLEQRLTDLTEGMSLLSGLTDLHTKYRDYCQTHPEKTESFQYGPTSLPALLMETRCMLGAEHQLKTVNAKLQQVLDNVDQK